MLGTWLLVTAPLLGLQSAALAWSDRLSGLALMVFAALALSWRFAWARWACAAVGLWVMAAPLLFWAPSAAGYLHGTLVGALVVGFAIGLPPEPGVSPLAATRGPDAPPGWSFNPSAWTQRLPIVLLALLGLHISRYLTTPSTRSWPPASSCGGGAAPVHRCWRCCCGATPTRRRRPTAPGRRCRRANSNARRGRCWWTCGAAACA
jgi:hypothetical protein